MDPMTCEQALKYRPVLLSVGQALVDPVLGSHTCKGPRASISPVSASAKEFCSTNKRAGTAESTAADSPAAVMPLG